jgi:hypothetical protein
MTSQEKRRLVLRRNKAIALASGEQERGMTVNTS